MIHGGIGVMGIDGSSRHALFLFFGGSGGPRYRFFGKKCISRIRYLYYYGCLLLSLRLTYACTVSMS